MTMITQDPPGLELAATERAARRAAVTDLQRILQRMSDDTDPDGQADRALDVTTQPCACADPSRATTSTIMTGQLNDLSAMIDHSPANTARDPEAQTWGRIAKITEEAGEVVAAFIGATGQNPRKGVTHTMADVDSELLDVAVTALAAHAHRNGNTGNPIRALADHLDRVHTRLQTSTQ